VFDQWVCVIGYAQAVALDDPSEGGQLGGLRKHRHEAWRTLKYCDVETEDAGRVELTETAVEGLAGDVVEPSLADEGGADEGGGEADAEEDLDEEVVSEHLGYGVHLRLRLRHRRRRRVVFHFREYP
jgi:hypothetical protein